MHVQYDAGLFRQGRRNILPQVMALPVRRKVITVHEVYEMNPYIARRPNRNGLISSLKQVKWDFLHRLERKEEGFAALNYFADSIIVHTQAAADVLKRKRCDSGKIQVWPHPAIIVPKGDRQKGRQRFGLPEEGVVILVFGFITPANDYATFFSAIEPLQGKVTFLLAGGPREGRYQSIQQEMGQAIVEKGLSASVVRTGYVEESLLPDLFAAADLFVSIARVKTASGPISRALGSGLPVLAADMDYTRELAGQSEAVIRYESGNAEALKQGIVSLLDKEYRLRLCAAADEYAKTHSFAAFAANHLQLYRRLFESHS